METYGEFIKYNENTGRDEFDGYVYSTFFAEKIQNRIIIPETGEEVLEGLTLPAFAKIWESNPEKVFKGFYGQIVEDKDLSELQEEIKEKVGIRIEFFNFYILCSFVNALIRESYFMLLKPTAKDIISEVKDAKEVTITNADGTKVTVTSKNLVDDIVKVIRLKGETKIMYEIDRIVRIDEIANNVVMQSKFVTAIAYFLKRFFPDAKRRKNCCVVSEPEQRLILRMLTHFELAPKNYTLTSSRFRQLIGYYNTVVKDEGFSNFPGFGYFPVAPVKYEDWSRKDKDWTKTSFILHPLQEGDTISLDNLKEAADNMK